jgi:hypothetical protein
VQDPPHRLGGLIDIQRDVEREIRRAQRKLKKSIPAYVRESRPSSLVAVPLLYSLIVPIALLDLWATLYQWTCFPLFGITRVSRAGFILIDRHKLSYLNGIEKLNCIYCGYANGVIAYVREIAGRTEKYWCPIQHRKPARAPHDQYRDFVKYGDAVGYRRRLPELRRQLERDRP